MNRLILAACVLALSGCAQNDQQACAGFGYQPGSDAFANCMMQRDAQRRQALAAYMQQQAQQQQQNLNQQRAAIQANRPVTTNCIQNGPYTNCTSQ